MFSLRWNKNSDDQITERLLCCLPILTAFLIPLKKSIPEIISLFLILFLIYFFRKKISIPNIIKYKYLLISSIFFFIWIVIRSLCLFSHDEFNNIFRYTGVLLIPLFILGTNTKIIDKDLIHKCLFAFVISNFIISIYSIIAAYITGDYLNTAFMALFPISWYVGVYAFSAIFSLYLIDEHNNSIFLKVLLWIIFFVSLITIYMASRRGIILSTITALAIIGYIKIRFHSNKNVKILILLALSLIIILQINNPRFQKINMAYTGYKYDIRLTMWDAALELITTNTNSFLFGFGLEDGYKKYNEKVKEIEHFPASMKEQLNSTHNDFLDILIMFGSIGLFSFLFLLLSLAHYAVVNKNYLLLSCLAMIVVQFFFGSYFFWFRTGKFSLFFLISILIILENSFYPKSYSIKK